MSRFFPDRTAWGSRFYVATIIAAGLPLLCYCLYFCIFHVDASWLYLGALTAVGSFFAVKIPSKRGKVQSLSLTVGEVFVFTAILLYGPQTAVVISVIDALVTSYRVQVRNLYKRLFNLAEISLVSYLVAAFFYLLENHGPPLDPHHSYDIFVLLLNLTLAALLYFVLNSGAVALAISLSTGKLFKKIWTENFLWASMASLAGASTAGLVFLNFQRSTLLSVGIAFPIVAVIYYAYRVNLDRIVQAQRHVEQLNELYHATIGALAMAIDAKDQSTHGHVHRVQALALGLARSCGVQDPNELEGIRAAALLHDIGKLAVPESILNKPTSLTEWEMEEMKAHPSVGADILDSVPFPYPVVPLVRYHHEKWDGSGYPESLKEEQIPLGARILSIADCYDALRSDRPYRRRMHRSEALDYILSESGKSFDPTIVQNLVRNIDALEEQVLTAENQAPQRSWKRSSRSRTGTGDMNVFHEIASVHKEVQAVYEIFRSIGSSLDISETLSVLGSKVQKLIPHCTCVVYLMDQNRNQVTARQCSGPYADAIEGLAIPVGDSVSGWVASNNHSLVNVSPAPDFRERDKLTRQFRSALAVPLSAGDRVLGVISLYSAATRAFQINQQRLLETIASFASGPIKNALVYEEAQEDAFTDVLTGLPNLRFFKTFGPEQVRRAVEKKCPISVIVMDLDNFKSVNDRFGHKIGDRVLVEIAHVLRKQMRKSDICVRYGGDEFLAILSDLRGFQAEQAIRRIQQSVEEHSIVVDAQNTVQVGISIGIANFPADGEDLELLIAAADRSMYKRKAARSQQASGRAQILNFEKRGDAN